MSDEFDYEGDDLARTRHDAEDERSRRQARLLTAAVIVLILLLLGTVAAFVWVTRPLQSVDRPKPKPGWTFGSAITSWGGATGMRLRRPQAVVYAPDGTILVADNPKPLQVRILKFSGGGAPRVLVDAVGSGPGQLKTAFSLAVDAQGNIYAADGENNRVAVFTSEGRRVREIPARAPQAVFVKGDTLYVGEDGSVAGFSLDGNLLGRIGTKGRANGQFDIVSGVFVDDADALYIADGALNRVQAYDTNNKTLWVSGKPPRDMNETERTFDYAADVDLGGDGKLYVLEGLGSQVAVVDPKSGKVLEHRGERGPDDGQLLQPRQMAFSADGSTLAIADTYNDRVQLIRITEATTLEKLTGPHAATGQEGLLGLPLMICVTALLPLLLVILVIVRRRRIADNSDRR